ncbi:MAG TPA: hypothetical protein VM509_05095, partial [Planctomycetota bacterium]|nr:hypothetical protein [Planctomycetota bacterium]
MFALLTIAGFAQGATPDAMEYVREHRKAHAALVSKKLDDARSGFERCSTLSPDNPTIAYERACVEARAAQTTRALDFLERAVEWGYLDADVAGWDEDLASLRKEKRFIAALERMRKLAPTLRGAPRNVRVLDGGNGDLSLDVAADPSGSFVAVAQQSGVIQLLDAATGHALRSSPPLGSPVWALAVDNSGASVAALTWDGKLHFWAVDGKSPPLTLPAIEGPEAWERLRSPSGGRVEFDSTGERVLVSGEHRGASVLSAQGVHLRAWREAKLHDVEPKWSPGGDCIAIADGASVIFSGVPTDPGAWPTLDAGDAVNCIGFHPDGRRVATGHDACLRLWDLPSRTLLFEHRLDGLARCAALEFSPDGARVAARVCHGPNESSSVLVLDAGTGKVLGSAQCRKEEWSAGHEARWSEDSNRLWFACLQEKAPLMELTLE